MVDCGPVSRAQWDEPGPCWSHDQWARWWDEQGCPHTAGLWRTLAEHQSLGDLLRNLAVSSLISTDWR